MKLSHGFLVMPSDLNAAHGVLFGGRMMVEMDYAASLLANRFIYDLEGIANTTAEVEHLRFRQPVYCGEYVTLNAVITEAKNRSIFIDIIADKEMTYGSDKGRIIEKVTTARFHMMTVRGGKSIPHGKSL